MKTITSILVLFADPNDVQQINEIFQVEKNKAWELNIIDHIPAGLKLLKKQSFDVILLDLQLANNQNMDILEEIASAAPEIPIIVFTERREKETERKALRAGAQDYLVKGEITRDLLVRAIRYAIDRKQAQEALRRSDARFQIIAENIGDVIYQMNLTQKFTYISPSIYQMFGYTQEEWVGTHLSDHASSKAYQQMLGIIVKSLKEIATFKDVIFETEMLHKDGTVIPVEILGRIILNENKIPVGLQGVTRDITERKETERQLRLQAVALESAANAIIITNNEGEIEWANPAFKTLTGYSADEVIGKNPRLLKSGQQDLAFYEDLWNTILSGQIWHGEFINKRKDGRLYNEEQTITPIVNTNREITHFIGIKQNVTDRKTAEEALRESESNLKKAQELARIGNWKWHIPTNHIEWSNQLNHICGIDEAESHANLIEIIGNWIHKDDQEKTIRSNQAFLQSHKAEPYEFRVLHSDGSERFLWTEVGEVIFDDQGNPQTVTGVIQDITERKKMELALQEERNLLAQRIEERTKELRKALKTKDEFLANMSHELRTPLTAILGMAQTLEMGVRGSLNEHQTRAVQMIHQSGDHLLNLINDILDISKFEAGKLQVTFDRVVVDDVCQSSMALVKGMAHEKLITLDYQIPDPSMLMHADGRRVTQILVNLLNNAVKFTPAGGHVSLEVLPHSDQDKISFIVQDTGIGIARKDTDRLFQPFTQLDGSLSRQYEGSGLGLALAKRLVEMHHGEIKVESEGVLKEGSRFTVTLPCNFKSDSQTITQAQPNRVSATEIETIEDAKGPQPARQPVILLAEDNQANIVTICEYLEFGGYQVEIANDGLEAIQQAKKYQPDLILMDIQMPTMNGFEAMRELRKDANFTETPIIALTALAMPGDEKKCLEAGANAYITKPVMLKELLKIIKSRLDSGVSPEE